MTLNDALLRAMEMIGAPYASLGAWEVTIPWPYHGTPQPAGTTVRVRSLTLVQATENATTARAIEALVLLGWTREAATIATYGLTGSVYARVSEAIHMLDGTRPL